MITLLQWPSVPPSRNQTPSAILVTVSGLASDRAAKKANPASEANKASSSARVFLISAQVYPQAMVKSIVSGGINGSQGAPSHAGRRYRGDQGRRQSPD